MAREGLKRIFNYDPIAQEEAAVNWLKEKLAYLFSQEGNANFAVTAAQTLAQRSQFFDRLNTIKTQLETFIATSGDDLAKAIATGDHQRMEELKADLPPELSGAIDAMYALTVKLVDIGADSISAYQIGYLCGMIAYEVAEDAVITAVWGAATAGTAGAAGASAPAIIAARVANFVRKLEKLRGTLKPGVYEKIVSAVSTAVWWGVKHFEICFVAGTPVHTANGLVPIEQIKLGDLVYARPENDPSSSVRLRPVLQTFVTHPTRLYEVTYRLPDGTTESVEGTGQHPFYVTGKDFIPAMDLAPDNELSLRDGGSAIVLSVAFRDAGNGDSFTTYNFEVEDDHTYFVGNGGVWVHNEGLVCAEAFQRLLKRADWKDLADPANYSKLLDAIDEELKVGLEKALKEAGDNAALKDQITKEFAKHKDDISSQFLKRAGLPDPEKYLELMQKRIDGTITTDELRDYVKLRRALREFKWGEYLSVLRGGAPDDMIRSHAHHILFKAGLGKAQRELVAEGMEILLRKGIDPLAALENLVWAPNIKGQHTLESLQFVVGKLREVDAAGGDFDDFAQVLRELGERAADIGAKK